MTPPTPLWKRALDIREFGEALNPAILPVCGYAALIGAVSGLVALGLLKLINFLTWVFFYGKSSFEVVSPAGTHLGLWIILIPLIGGGIVGVMIYLWEPTLKGHGIPEAMQAVLLDKGVVRGRVAFLKPLATALAIGTGGPFGAEGPIIQTGGALGSLLAQKLKLDPYDRRVLLAAGAAGGMAATFMAPLAGILVAVELLLFEFRARSFIPVAIASVVADAISVHFRGSAPMFAMPAFVLASMQELWLFALLGLICGVVGLIMKRILFWLEDLFDELPLHPVVIWSPLIGALLLGIIGYFSPEVLGTGYTTIREILNDRITMWGLLSVAFAKFWALVISLGSGTTGGVFAPSLIVGGGIGGAFAMALHHFFPAMTMAAPAFYAICAMAAVFAAIARAPFTAIIFLFELSQNPHAILPLIVCCIFADGLMRLFSADSIMTGKLARRGMIVSQDYAAPLFLHTAISEVMLPLTSLTPEQRAAAQVRVRPHDSVGIAARALARHAAAYALVFETEGVEPIGVVYANDIWTLQRDALFPDAVPAAAPAAAELNR